MNSEVIRPDEALPGDVIRATYAITPTFLDGIGITSWNSRLDQLIEKVRGEQSSKGYHLLDVTVDPKSYTVSFTMKILPVKTVGLGVLPAVAVVAIVEGIVALGIVVGIIISLNKVERIIDKPAGALTIWILGGLALYFLLVYNKEKQA